MTGDWFAFNEDDPAACDACGWTGIKRNTVDQFEELFDQRCPRCDAKLGPLISYPTLDAVREAAAAGNEKAQKELPELEALRALSSQRDDADDASPRPRLYLSQDPGLGHLSAVEFGRVDDGQDPDAWVGVGDQVGLLHELPGRRCVGFLVKDVATYDPDDPAHATLWDGPRFDVPVLGLTDAAPNEIVVAARALFGTRRTLNRELFSLAIHGSGEVALRGWLRCLQSGDSMAHYGLGYTLFDLGRIPEAYRHLRYYAEIAPGEAWAWCWLGKAAAALGETVEARAAFTRALEVETEEDETDARELLAALDAGRVEVPPLTPTPPAHWQDQLHALVVQLPPAATTWSTDTDARVLVDTAPVPVWLAVSGLSGVVEVQVLIGTCPGMGDTGYGQEDMIDILDEDATDLVTDDDDVWLVRRVNEVLQDLEPRTLQMLVFGAAAVAAGLRNVANAADVDDEQLLLAPPTYEEAERRFNAED